MSDGDEVSRVQSPDQGTDKSVDGPTDPKELGQIKMTGEGAPGSHSAVFGLTPDGQKHDETSSETTIPRPAHSAETAMGGGKVPDSTEDSSNTGSGGTAGAGVADQMDKPTLPSGGPTEAEGEKPGGGHGTELGSQGSGDVSQEDKSTVGGGSMMDKAKSYMSGS